MNRNDAAHEPMMPQKERKRKKNACLFCGGLFSKLSDHLKNVHKNEPEMLDLAKKNDQQARKAILSRLTARGNIKVNMRLHLAKEKDVRDFIPKYKKHDTRVEESALVPCLHCKHMYSKSCLSRHLCVAQYKAGKTPGTRVPILRPSAKEWNLHLVVSKELSDALGSLQ